MVNKPVKDDNAFFNLEQQDKRAELNPLVVAHTPYEIFEMVDGGFVTTDDLLNLFSDGESKCFVLMSEFVQPAFQFWGDDKIESHYKGPHE